MFVGGLADDIALRLISDMQAGNHRFRAFERTPGASASLVADA